MAASDDSANSWPGFLSELSKSFLILRDIFGYALPGAVFLGVGLICRRFSLHDLQYYVFEPYHPPAWLAAIVGLGACYAAGHVVAAIAHLPYNFKKEPVESSHKMILARGQHPELLIELDRQSTMTMMRGATGAALLLGSVFFWWCPKTPPLGWMLSVAGILLLLVFYCSAKPHIARLGHATCEAVDCAIKESAQTEAGSLAHLKQVLRDAAAALAEALKKP
jgi:hypothetical protein